jgi:hypothetical protein
VVATGGNRAQMNPPPKPRKQAETVAVGCDQLPKGAHGKGRVYTTSLFVKEGVTFLAPRGETSPANPKARRTRTTLTAVVARRGRRAHKRPHHNVSVAGARVQPRTVDCVLLFQVVSLASIDRWLR